MKLRKKRELLSAKEISKHFDLSYQSVNYYTNIGLFKVSSNRGNKRLYSLRHVTLVLKKIRTFKRRGYSLRVIRDELI